MVARDSEELADDLYDLLQWRRLELSAAKAVVERLRPPDERTPHGRMALRSATLLIYAHWEGYVKQACEAYLRYVAVRRLSYRELSMPFLRLATRNMAVRGTSDAEALDSLAGLVAGDGTARARIPTAGVVDTGANLRYSVLMRILNSVGLPTDPYETKEALIDRSLCDARNSVAHGKEYFPDVPTVLMLHDEVLGMMVALRTAIIDAVARTLYRQTA